MTDEVRAEIHAVMESHGGNATEAAKAIHCRPATLAAKIRGDPELAARWAAAPPAVLGEAEVISRPPPVPAPSDLAVAKSMDEEDKLLRTGLSRIGLSGSSLELAINLQKFQSQHFSRAIEMIGGGITKAFFDLMAEVDAITQEINSLDSSPDNLERERMLRQDRALIVEAMGRTYDRASAAAKTQAVIRKMMGENRGKEQRAKPSNYLAIQAQPGSTVKVTMEEDEGSKG